MQLIQIFDIAARMPEEYLTFLSITAYYAANVTEPP